MVRSREFNSSSYRRAAALTGLLLFTIVPALAPPLAADPTTALTVGVVQFEITPELVRDERAFSRSVSQAVTVAANRGSDIVVFPEYQNAFLPFTEHPQILDGYRVDTPVPADADNLIRRHTDAATLREFLMDRAPAVRQFTDSLYGTAAGKHEVYILAGTRFSAAPAASGDTRLTNQAILYGPDGEAIYTQEKAFLTPFEKHVLHLDAGDPEAAEPVTIDGWSVAVTICRDTYFTVWDDLLGDSDLWIDIRGEGTTYDQSVRRRLSGALPERLEENDIPFGIVAFLTGEVGPLFWEGRSAVVTRDPQKNQDSPEVLEEARTVDELEVLTHTLEPDEE